VWGLKLIVTVYISFSNYYYMLQSQDFRVSQVKEPCIRVNTRELDRELCIDMSTLYTKL